MSAIGNLFKSPSVPKAAPVPTVNDAMAQRNTADSALTPRGRATTILTSSKGLPDLGTTVAPTASAGK